jgi:hypothetical protein
MNQTREMREAQRSALQAAYDLVAADLARRGAVAKASDQPRQRANRIDNARAVVVREAQNLQEGN